MSTINCSLEVTQIDTIGEVLEKTAWNQFDEHGLLVSVRRNQGEKNWNLRRRIFDAFANAANSTYRGMVNGVTRELGLELYYPVSIQPKLSPATDRFYAPDPYISINDSYIYLYSDYSNGVLDYQIDRFKLGGNYEKLAWLIDFINQTTYFEAGLVDVAYMLDNSAVLVNQTNRGEKTEAIQVSSKFQLEEKYVVAGSINFTDGESSFEVEMNHLDEVDRAGRYHIDYPKGVVTVYNIPPVETTISYQYSKYPFYPVASPVIISDLNSEDFKIKMFQQTFLENGEYKHGLPTELGNDLIAELMSVYPMYWGV